MNAYSYLSGEFFAAWQPPPNLTVSKWSDEHRRLSSESSAEPGQWRTSRAPYQAGMMDAVCDHQTHTVSIMTSAQIGKTEALNNVVGYYIHTDPCPILVLQPTVEMATTWSKDRLTPMLRDTPVLRSIVGDMKSRDAGQTMLHKSFRGGHITMAGANSPAGLASRPIRVVLCDEVDRYPASAGTEGDPVSLAKKRTSTFWNRKIILTSTPTIKGASRIESSFLESDQRHYYVPCPHCGEKQRLKWSNIVFDKEDLPATHYACVNGCVIDEKDKPKMLLGGEWVAEGEFNGHAGFHLNELYSPWRKWSEIVDDFLVMKKSPDTLKTFINTSLGETWEEKGEEVDHTGLLERRENYDHNSLPDDILLITAAVDVQDDRLEALSQGWGVDRERWNVEKAVFWGKPDEPDVWRELDEWLLGAYQVAGRQMKIACATVDSGGHHTDSVYNFCKARQGRRVFAVKGSSQYYSPLASKPSQVGRQRVMLYSVGTDTAKDSILLSSVHVESGANAVHFPSTFDDEDFRQLTAESKKTKIVQGNKRFYWAAKRERNEVLDLHVYNLAAYAIINPDIDALISKRNKAPAVQAEEAPLRSTQVMRPKRKAKNWVTDI